MTIGPAYASRTMKRYGVAALLLSIGAIATALGFQYVGGYHPCPLCEMERYAYYAAIPALLVALMLASRGHVGTAAAIFGLVALAFLGNAGLGAYHAGAEWKYWPGPDSCGGERGLATSAGNLLQDIETIKIVRCDEASWTMLGLSFAGWNAVISLIIAGLAAFAAGAAAKARRTIA